MNWNQPSDVLKARVAAKGAYNRLLLGLGAVVQHWSVQIPAQARYGGVGAALIIGAIAGLYPSRRAARLPPSEAFRSA